MSLAELSKERSQAFSNISKHGKKYLRFLETNNLHHPRDVLSIGTKLHKLNLIKSNDKWRMYERIVLSALELNEVPTAKEFLHILEEKFPQSNRVCVLLGMVCEQAEDYEQSKSLYSAVLQKDGNHMSANKRMIAIEIAQRNDLAAIRLLCSYLQLYGSDFEGWKQLSMLYQYQHCYELSKFCLEECILMDHDSHLFYTQYADMLYNIGGKQNMIISLKYFSQSVVLSNDRNTRALFGILMVCVLAFM